MFFDSHVHLNEKRLLADVEGVIKRAREKGVTRMLVPSYDIVSIENAITLAHKYEEIFIALGIHPSDTRLYDLKVLNTLGDYAGNNTKVRAIGEIGLDYYWAKTDKERAHQRLFFIEQIKLADSLHLPVIVHMRDATADTIEILTNHTPKYGFVMHCFSGSSDSMQVLLKMGAYISFGGPITFLNAVEPKQNVASVPLEKLLIETDAPFLTPHPFRGKINEPGYIPLIAAEIARIRGLSAEKIAQITTANACNFFHVENK